MSRSHPPERALHTKSSGSRHPESEAVLVLVREKVRRFILDDAPIEEFRTAIIIAGRRRRGSTHPLTGTIFRRIVQEAIRERRKAKTLTLKTRR